MSYSVRLAPAAERAIRKLERPIQKRIIKKIETLKDDPRPHGCEKLSNSEFYRIRIGDYRIIYEMDDEALTVQVVKVGDRKEIYAQRRR